MEFPQGNLSLSCVPYHQGMTRIVAALLILGTGFDLYMLDGKYTQAGSLLLYSTFRHFR